MRYLAPFLAALALMFTVSAASAQEVPAPQAFIDKIATDVLNVVKNAKMNETAKATTLENIFATAVDFDWVGKFVLGRHFRAAAPAQQLAYLNAYKPFLIKNYVSRLTKYTGQTYKITGTRKGTDGASLVSMQLLDPSGPPVMVDYRVSGAAGAFKVTDIIVEDVSLITTQRAEFNAFVSKNGLPALITALNKKTAAANANMAAK